MRNGRRVLNLFVCSIIAFGTVVSLQAKQSIVRLGIEPGKVIFSPMEEYERLSLTVSGPANYFFSQTYDGDGVPEFVASKKSGTILPDGQYRFEVRATPLIDQKARTLISAAREAGNESAIEEARNQGLLPAGRLVQSGWLKINAGEIVVPGTLEEMATKDIVHLDDVIIDGSLCVGNDCYSGLAFGFDTIVLMENNLRIFFDDTSTIQNYPRNDWRIIANDSTDAGGNYFAVQDATEVSNVMVLEAGAPDNSLYVDSHGDVGINTSTPYYELHIVDGDSPAIRLDQDGSYGWTPQKWDICGNESNFFIRDATHASKLPFRIQPEAPTDSIFIKSNGRIGIGTGSPATSFEIERTGEHAEITLDVTDAKTWSFRSNNPTGKFVITNVSDTRSPFKIDSGAVTNTLTMDATGVGILTNSPAGALDVNGSIFQRGSSLHADYVFTTEYRLESIEEHAEFMWQERHLPAIPGVKIDAEGREFVEIGSNRRGIVEELEKAHIYIEQLNRKNKEIEELRQMIAVLGERIAILEGEGDQPED